MLNQDQISANNRILRVKLLKILNLWQIKMKCYLKINLNVTSKLICLIYKKMNMIKMKFRKEKNQKNNNKELCQLKYKWI